MPLIRHIKNILSQPKVLVLMYHRIADESIDPWELAVTQKNFEEHLDVLRGHVISVPSLIHQLSNQRIEKNAVCITFDDGYTDNFLHAVPLLKKHACPATFFIPSGLTNTNQMFWWDLLTDIFLKSEQLPSRLEIEINGQQLVFLLENNGRMTKEQLQKHASWKWPSPAPSQRSEIYLSLWQQLRDLPDAEVKTVMDYLVEWSGFVSPVDREAYPMTREQLNKISRSNLFSIGTHTVNHPALASRDAVQQRKELTACRSFLYSFNNVVNAAAYPYGNYNDDTVNIMRAENFAAGFTTSGRPVSGFDDIHQLGRIMVGNLSGKEFKKQLSTWYQL